MAGDVTKIIDEARERFRKARDADAENRRDALDDLKFAWNLDDYQWGENAKKLRAGRPCLTENRLPQFIRIVVNSQRMNRPSINVSPVDSKGDIQVARVFEGMIRHIEQYSRADLAYDTAFEAAVTSGIGYFRVSTRQTDEGDQEVYISPVENSFSVYDDPDFSQPDGSDRKWCFVTDWITREAFKERFGKEPASFDSDGTGDRASDWIEDDRVMIAEYWRIVGGKVEQYLLSWDTVLESTEWAGSQIPIIPVFGECKTIESKKYRKSLIRDAKQLQMANNFWFSAETESVAAQPKTPWTGPVGAFETDWEKWSNANNENHAFLQYDMVEGAPPPMRVDPPAFPSAIRETRMAIIEGIKSTFGIYDASLGARSNEVSGIALRERQQQGDLATYHFLDNMTRAIRYAGSVIIEILPRIYDTQRVVRVLEPDGQAQMVAVNEVFPTIDPQTMQMRPPIRLDSGRYDVVVKAGPSYQTQREEAAAAMTEMIKAYPPLAQVAGDLLFKNMDWPEADKIAERMKPQSELPPQVQQQMQQMQQMLEQGQKYVQQLEGQLQKAEIEKQSKDLDRKKVEVQLQAKVAQDELMSGDTTGEEMLRLREENARQSIELKMKDLQLLEARLGVRAGELSQREAAIGERESQFGMTAGGEVDEEGGEPTAKVVDVLGQLAAVMQQFAESQTQLTRVLSADRVPIRGEDGRIAAVRTMLQ